MSGILFNAGIDPERDERARRAVKAFRAMQPTLTAYAKMISKRSDVRVELANSGTPATDDKKIFYKPPIELGDQPKHDRQLCDRRDENLQQRCPACAVREQVLIAIYHEIGHIAKGSFTKPTAGEVEQAFNAAIRENGSEYADRIKVKFDSAPRFAKNSLQGLATLINEYLPFLINALEDARVDREMYKARKGLKPMFDADVWRTFEKGVPDKDGSGFIQPWKKMPQNSQVMVGAYCLAAGYDTTGWFIPPVEEALNDTKLRNILRKVETLRSASGTYQLSFEVLVRLRELGFCGTPADPDPEPEPQEGDGDEPNPEQDPEENDSPEEGEDNGQGDAADAGGEGEGSSDSSSEEPSSDEGEGGSDRESEEGQGDDRGDDAGGPESQGSPEASSDGGLGDDEGTEPDEADPGASDEGDSGSESSGDGPSEADDSDERTDAGGESRDEAGGERSDHQGDQSDEADSGASTESSEESNGSESGDRSEPSSGDDADPDGTEGEGGGSTGDEQADGEADRGAGDPGESAPADGDATPSPESTEGDDEGTSSIDDPVDADSPGEPGTSSEGGSPDSEPAPEDGLAEEQNDGTDSGDDSGIDPSLEPDPIDNGADSGKGGIEVIEDEKYDDVPMGTADDLDYLVHLVHPEPDDKPTSIEEQVEKEMNEEAIDRAIIQGLYFETPSRNIFGVREHHYGQPVEIDGVGMSKSWERYRSMDRDQRIRRGAEGMFDAEERILAPALLKARIAFADNRRGKELRHRKSGKVDGRVLGKRAVLKDERLFAKKILPGKKDYFVLIGMDVSGSTVGQNIVLEKKAVMAQAELLERMGIPFSIYAHTGDHHNPFRGRGAGLDLDIYHIKGPNDPWNPEVRQRLIDIGPSSCNLDGHTLEYYRKRLDEQSATNRILLYYTDGKMPAENHDEELEILQREIRYCRQRQYTLLGVGIRTDSPVRHGLDTVQVDEDSDLVKVVEHLEKRLI